MSAVVIAMDPHKRSATIEVMAGDETVLDRGRFATDGEGYRMMLQFAKRHPERTWAIEGCNGIGRHIADHGTEPRRTKAPVSRGLHADLCSHVVIAPAALNDVVVARESSSEARLSARS